MIFVIDFSTLRDFETQLTDSSICEKEKDLILTKDNAKFKNKNIFHHDDNTSIDEKFFIDDDNNIDIKLKSITRKKIKSFQQEENFENKIMQMLIRKLLN